MWYVIQTMSGQEEHVIQMIRKIVPSELYTDCFTLYYERLWRKQQKSIVHVERLFSGYVFIITDCPQEIFFHLKDVPALSKLMSDPNFVFLPLNQDEETFFSQVSDDEHVVRLSYVKTGAGGHILRIRDVYKRQAVFCICAEKLEDNFSCSRCSSTHILGRMFDFNPSIRVSV